MQNGFGYAIIEKINRLSIIYHEGRYEKMEMVLLGGGLLVIIIAVIIAVVSSIATAVAAVEDEDE